MEIERTTLLLHGGYVAFVFAVVLFGALAFRQVSDNLEVRRLRMGEDRTSFVSAPGVLIAVGGLALAAIVGAFLIARPQPRIYFYALPMILAVQFLQMLTRVYLQRTLVKTHGFVLRSFAFDRTIGIPFANVIRADIHRFAWWAKVTLTIVGLRMEHVTFRIFPFSEPALIRVLERWCGCEIRTVPITPANPNGRIPKA